MIRASDWNNRYGRPRRRRPRHGCLTRLVTTVVVLAVLVGIFQGGVQALSRSHFAKIIPAEKSGEYFGLFDICGKGASFLGTMIVSVGSQLTGSVNVGLGSIAVLFVIGFVLFRVSCRTEHAKQV